MANRQRRDARACRRPLTLELLATPQHISSCADPAALIVELQAVMTEKVGPFRTAASSNAALAEIDRIAQAIAGDPMSSGEPSDSVLVDWLDLRNMTLVASSCPAALARQDAAARISARIFQAWIRASRSIR